MGDVVAALRGELGESVLASSADERFHGDWSGVGRTTPLAVIAPRSTAEVAAAVRICQEHGQSLVPQGGLTGLAGGATPRSGDVVISLERFAGVESMDEVEGTMIVRAGTTLQAAQDAATAVGWELTYDLGARGSCQIGGNIATNAGGNRVIRYGMTREHVLGLEVVLADGTVVSNLSTMLKNNAGYDWKHWFIGSEGTLGIITRAALRLRPLPASRATALCALADFDSTVRLLNRARRICRGLTAFEVMWPEFYRHVTDAYGSPPLPVGDQMYAVVELTDDDSLESLIDAAAEAGEVLDAAIAGSIRDTRAIWAIREGEPIDRLGDIINFDVSMRFADIGDAASAMDAAIRDRWPAASIFLFGHIGDGNLHLSLSVGDTASPTMHAVDEIVYEITRRFRGSVSAEHGIGTLKRDYLGHSRSPEEIALMQRLKTALDPTGILNPGKVLPQPQPQPQPQPELSS